MDEPEPPRLRKLTVRLPADLVSKLTSAAEISHRTVDQMVHDVLAQEIARWDGAFGGRPPDRA
jgi:predicted transcriptional regulator